MEPDQIAIAERVAEQHRHHKKALFFWVWGALLVMTAIEVYLTYQNMEPVKMLTILMGLSLIKEIGRASCRERVYILAADETFKKISINGISLHMQRGDATKHENVVP